MSSPATTSAAGNRGFPDRVVRRAIFTALLVILLGALDQTIVTVAVPTMVRDLGDVGWIAWVVSSYLVAATVVTPLYGRYGDQYGRRRALLLAVVLFMLASVACAMAQTMPQLVWARVAQGIGGGGLLAGAQALVADVVTPRERGRYQGWIAGVWAFANVGGPVVGGLLTHQLSWHWIFWINLPLCALALWLIHDSLGMLNGDGTTAPFNIAGSLWLVVGLLALMVPITRIGQGVAWSDALNTGMLIASVPVLAGFIRHERRSAAPVVPIHLLSNQAVANCSALGFLVFVIMITLSVMVPLRAQWVLQQSVDESAWLLLSMSIGIPFAASIAGRYMHRHARVRPLLLTGVVMAPCALLVLVLLPTQVPAWIQMPCLFLLGMGFGLQLPTALVALQHAVPPTLMGAATSLSGLSRQLGGAIGLALLTALLMWLMRAQLPAGQAGGLEALVNALAAGTAVVDRQALDGTFRAVLVCCLVIALIPIAVVVRMPETRLDERHP